MTPERWRAVTHGEARDLRAWLWRRLLWWLRGPYALGVWWRNRRFDRGRGVVHVPVPVLSVGNVTVGGTGKTPCVEYLAALVSELGLQVAILSRGYGSTSGTNDEAMLLEENVPHVPHLQGPDRVQMAGIALAELESEAFVLDDGFQHRRLARHWDLVLVDASDPWAGNYLLPRGGLREPKKNLRRAHAVLLTRCDSVSAEALAALEAEVRQLAPKALIAHAVHAPRELLNGTTTEAVDALRGRTVAAFCGIGNPAAFRRTLDALGAVVHAWRTYPDHHAYTRSDVDELTAWAKSMPADVWLVTTQKDWVKLRIAELGQHSLWAVRIGMDIVHGREALEQAVVQVAQQA